MCLRQAVGLDFDIGAHRVGRAFSMHLDLIGSAFVLQQFPPDNLCIRVLGGYSPCVWDYGFCLQFQCVAAAGDFYITPKLKSKAGKDIIGIG